MVDDDDDDDEKAIPKTASNGCGQKWCMHTYFVDDVYSEPKALTLHMDEG